MCTNCSCGTEDKTADVQIESQPVVATYSVTGMTCGHCASSVSEQVGRIEGVAGVEVDVTTGMVTVRSSAPLDREAVQAAVDEAGYELAPA
ncbi:heavy-metal-associated domain-containing protein [Kribbella sp. DT2]|uniref:heavy-metal-associated domain-containing protein n=1 Tax=Kribbella sp. DT2 TaxID=3393427 RepID=UPI003CEA41EF